MKKVIYIGLMILVIVTTGVLIVKLNITDNNEDEIKEECQSITGGGFDIIFNTNSDVALDTMHVCIACPPNTYLDLPVPTKEGYVFDGWYYDVNLTKKVEVLNTIDITPIPTKQDDCITGYTNITLYAKWNTIDKQ